MPEKGLPVFLEYDQDALDAAYDQAAYAPNREQLIERRVRDSVRGRIGEPERLAYGPAEIERLDIYRSARPAAPVFVFIHGGAWRSCRSKDFTGPAEMFLAARAHYVVPDFAWVQDVGGSLMVLADPGLPCRRLDPRERRAPWRRSEPALSRWPILGRTPRRGRTDDRLAMPIRPAGRHHQGRHVRQRHVRSDASAAVGTQSLCAV